MPVEGHRWTPEQRGDYVDPNALLLDIAAAIVITLLMFVVVPWATGIDLRLPLPR